MTQPKSLWAVYVRSRDGEDILAGAFVSRQEAEAEVRTGWPQRVQDAMYVQQFAEVEEGQDDQPP